ncbi:MAG: hypothetical protein N4A45_01535 [Flavobacteriales bacterium]|jgi:hypothetical protein|nr:hypothetical protein [Flavobacteriales bacterium]
MIHIDLHNPSIVSAKENHYKFLRFIIMKKLNGTSFDDTPPLSKMNTIKKVNNINKEHGIPAVVFRFLNNEENFEKVLIGTPEELDDIKLRFTKKKEIAAIKKLLNYNSFINYHTSSTYRFYNAYNLAENLDIPTCVYCNRMYTKTVISKKGEKITRPTFDHWFPKGQYPILALSFYNLIPSCTVCNCSVKGEINFELSTHFHPYYINPDENFKYSFSFDHKDYDKFKFKIKTNKESEFSKKSIEAFKLQEIYETHEDEIVDLIKIKDAYSEKYLDTLEKEILGKSLDRDDIYRLAFGVHYQEAKFDRRPLSKMKNDLLKELGIIK